MGQAGRFGGGGPLCFCQDGGSGLMREDDEEGGREKGHPGVAEREVYLAEMAKALAEVVAELKEVNTSLKAIARSQAQQASQKRPQPGS